MRNLHITAESPHSTTTIHAAFGDRDYWRSRLELYSAGAPALDLVETDSDGSTRIAITMRFGGEQLPAVLRPLRLGSLHVVQREQWRPDDDDRLLGTIDVVAPGTPISGHGDVTLAGHAGGTRLSGTAVVDVRVPLIGGPIAAFLVTLLADGIRDIVRVTDRWLDAT